jgi:hypothetical protein
MNPQTAWISIDTRVPKSGQTVEARTLYSDELYVVAFEAEPARRWEGKNIAYQFEYFSCGGRYP